MAYFGPPTKRPGEPDWPPPPGYFGSAPPIGQRGPGVGATYVPPPDTVYRSAQQGFQAGLSPQQAYKSNPANAVGREAQFTSPYGIPTEHAGEKALLYISPEEVKAHMEAGQVGACISWKDWNGITIPQPGGSLKDCLFDWTIGLIAVAVIAFGIIFLVRGAK